MTRYPLPPWRMCGPAVISLCPLPAEVARRELPEGLEPLTYRGRGLCVVLAAEYRGPSTLAYSEATALVAVRGAAGYVAVMVVDSEPSQAGGVELWNVPKELASFRWEGEPSQRVEVDGLLVMSWTPVRRAPRLPGRGTFIGGLDGSLVRGRLQGHLALLPRRVRLEIPSGSPLERLELEPPRLSLAGRVDARAGGGRSPAHQRGAAGADVQAAAVTASP